MITVHETMYSAYRSKILFSGFGDRKAPNSMGKSSILGGPSTPRHQALCHAIKSVWRSAQDASLWEF